MKELFFRWFAFNCGAVTGSLGTMMLIIIFSMTLKSAIVDSMKTPSKRRNYSYSDFYAKERD